MARIRVQSCGHLDFPCCGCGSTNVCTGQDAIDAARDDAELMRDAQDYDSIPGDGEIPDELFTDTPLGEQLDGGYEPDC